MVHKKSGGWRLCSGYHWFNARTIPGRYPVAHILAYFLMLHGKIFLKIDVVRAYHKIPVKTEDIPKMAIITPFRLFEFMVMPFGLCNAAQTF